MPGEKFPDIPGEVIIKIDTDELIKKLCTDPEFVKELKAFIEKDREERELKSEKFRDCCPDCGSKKAEIKKVVRGLCLKGTEEPHVIVKIVCECLDCGTTYVIYPDGKVL